MGGLCVSMSCMHQINTPYKIHASLMSGAEVGSPGGGGEYDCVEGFGWSNGVALFLLQEFGWHPEVLASVPA
jgi:hypothetical protein